MTAQEEPGAGIDESSYQIESAVENPSQIDFLNKSSFNWHDPFTKLPDDFASFGKNVFTSSNVSTLTGLTMLTLLLMATDHEITTPLHQEYRAQETFHDVAKKITYIGDGEFHLGIAALFGGVGLIINDNRAIRTALQIVESEIVTGLTVQVIKHISGRESPQSASRPGGMFRPFPNINDYHQDQTKYYSFPSGHVSTSMAVLTVIAENYPELKWLKPVGYTVIGLVGVGLVARGWHWLSDYPLAVAIGYTFGKIIANRNLPEQENQFDETGLSFQPVLMNGIGVGLTYKF
jgi:membrane-associated phospholipid phosphatase